MVEIFAPLIAVFIEEERVFLAASSGLPASKVSFSSFMDVLHRVDKARWMTAALFGPVGSETNNPIMLPGERRVLHARNTLPSNSHRHLV